MARRKASGATPAINALRAAGVPFELHTYDHDPASMSFGAEAATALGVAQDRVFKTLLACTDQARLVVAIVPVNTMLDLKALATVSGAKRAEMADPSQAQRSTGYVVGGISPIGQRRALPTILDESAQDFETVLVSGGRRGLDVELSPADLAAVTGAQYAAVSRGP